jgi:hypothetical protein
MIKWIKEILGIGPVDVKKDTPKVKQATPVAAPKTQAKKPTTKKVVKVDLDGMSKKDLLAHAKKSGVKANASMNKAAILKVIKNG